MGPEYHTTHANGIEISPNQNKTRGNIFIFSSFWTCCRVESFSASAFEWSPY